MSDWYSRALTRSTGAPPPQSYRPPPQQQQPWRGDSRVSTPPPQQGPDPMAKRDSASLSELLQVQAATGRATPGVGHRLNPDPCPQCGSGNYFEAMGPGKRRGPPPAPHCFTCGYNGMFEQGLEGNWVSAAQ